MQPEVKLSVRQLVEFVMRGGSIDNRFGGVDRALEGSRIHRKLQKEAGESYRPEVFLSHTCVLQDITFTVEGRADGIYSQEDGEVIDEIKTTAAPYDQLTEDFNRLHWAQAMCYGYIYCLQNGLAGITVRLTYYQVEEDRVKRFFRHFDFSALQDHFKGLLQGYLKWAQFVCVWKEQRNQAVRAMPFPFGNYRPGQRELAVAVYRTICRGAKLYCQAPTGIGKTMSTLFPSVKAVGEEKAEKLFYLTAKTITRQAAQEAFRQMRARGLRFKSVTLTAKDKVCFLPQRECNPEACPYADGYYDRVNDVVYKMLQQEDCFDRACIERYAEEHQLCPFELSLDLTLWCDGIICDYNYLFDPNVYLRRFFADRRGEYVFLVDEAHNLVDRAREMYSAQLSKADFLAAKKEVGKSGGLLYRALGQMNRQLLALRKEVQQQAEDGWLVRKDALDQFNAEVGRFAASCEEWLGEHRGASVPDTVLELYFSALGYLKIAELYDERYVTCLRAQGSELSVRQYCLDPSFLLQEAMKRGKATILFSATLAPLDYFTDILGGDENSKKYALGSPFSQDNLLLLVADRISTRYKQREESKLPISQMIYEVVAGRKGNYMVYFPSYQYMRETYEVFCEQYPQVQTVQQTAHMSEEEREEFLARFDADNAESLVGFCVMGGIFSEGIDLKGDRLIGTVVVGVGLPQISRELDVIRTYFDQNNGMGFEYAYQFPGMNKVLQAAGRVIRGESDRGVVLLIDDRFTAPRYRALFPAHWSHYRRVSSSNELKRLVCAFWRDAAQE